MKRTLITLLLAIFTMNAVAADGFRKEGAELGEWTQDLEAAKTLAAEKKLPILMNFTGSDWCYWCKLMDENVFEKEAWVTYAKANVVMVALDFPKDKTRTTSELSERNDKLQKDFGVQGYPTFVLVDSAAKTEYARLSAGKGKTPKTFSGEIDTALAFFTGLTPEDRALYDKANAEKKAIMDERMAWMQKRPEQTPENMKKYRSFSDRLDKAERKLADLRIDVRARGMSEENGKKLRAAYAELNEARGELRTWLASDPQKNEENNKKFQAFTTRIQDLTNKMDDI
jgi:thioredoxin-related protein